MAEKFSIDTKRLRQARRDKKWTQDVLAEKVGGWQDAISEYETGDREITLPNAKRIAEALGVSLEWLIGEEEEQIKYLVPFLPLYDIIGREEDIAILKDRLGVSSGHKGKSNLQVLTAVRGWPGVGKTSLTTLLANDREVHRHFSDGVI